MEHPVWLDIDVRIYHGSHCTWWPVDQELFHLTSGNPGIIVLCVIGWGNTSHQSGDNARINDRGQT